MVWRFLRSRRLAIFLLVGLTVYAWIVTLVPLTSLDPDAAAAWDARHPFLAVVVNALGLHSAYSSPIFIAAALLLTLATATCAWERTRAAVREWRGRSASSLSKTETLSTFPTCVIGLDPGIGEEDALARVVASLTRLHLRGRRSQRMVTGSGGALGLLGSPLFHWALVGLFVFAGVGQLTRYEGYVNMIEGDALPDSPDTYVLELSRAMFVGARTFTGVRMELVGIDFDHPVGGESRGRAPLIRLSQDGRTLRERWVYPNKPLRYGPLMIQRATTGPALLGTVSIAGARGPEQIRLYYEELSKSPRAFSFSGPTSSATLTVEVTPVGQQKVGVVVRGASGAPTQTIGVGETATLAEGATFKVDALTYYAQIQVVNDWSVPWVYGMFILGTIGMALTTFVPPRSIHVTLVDDAEGKRLHVLIRHRRNDPAFPRRAECVLREGLEGCIVSDVAKTHEGERTP